MRLLASNFIYLTSYINEAQLWASIDIHLIKHSTGQPHPAAAKPVLHFDNIHYLPGHSSIMLEVSGDTLCFLLNNYFPFVSADPVTLVIFNWKSGHAKVVSAYLIRQLRNCNINAGTETSLFGLLLDLVILD